MRAVFDAGDPDVIRQAGPVFGAAEVFDWIKRVHSPAGADMARQKLIALKKSWGLAPPEDAEPSAPQPTRPAEVYRTGGTLLDPGPFLPASDDTFESWIARTREALGGEFGIQAPCIECASWDAMERLRSLLAPILSVTGPRSYRYNAFAGDYRLTPFGYHVDPHQEAVFQVVLSGRRRGLFWEGLALSEVDDAAWVDNSNRLPATERPPDVTFDLEPGDIVFWPGTQVHGFQADGPSLALSIVVDRASVRHRHEVVSGLQVASMQGAAALPPIANAAPVKPGDKLRRRTAMRLAYERFDDTLILGICGRTLDWPDRNSIPAAIATLDHIASKQELEAGEVARTCATEDLDEAQILDTLTTLVSFGYLAQAVVD